MNTTISKKYVVEELKNGIVELTIVSEHSSASRTISATLSPNHLPDMKPTISKKPNVIVLWNMVEEQWQSMHLSTIGDLERLTGHGVKDEAPAYVPVDALASFLK
tara:strand:+ start:1103 stop:1417 length:315 start_codon:yes stop_codon:yes gene_type:complete